VIAILRTLCAAPITMIILAAVGRREARAYAIYATLSPSVVIRSRRLPVEDAGISGQLYLRG